MSSNYLSNKIYEQLQEEVKNGYVVAHRHSSLPITNYTYSRLTEQENHWNHITMMTSGLIVDDNKRIIFNCSKKFFNYNQNFISDSVYNNLKNHYKIYEKLDGSAIWVVSDEEYGLIVCSKSSFDSEHVKWATEIIKKKYLPASKYFYPNICYSFELIWPENRIVVDYGDEKSLKLWGIKTQDGRVIELESNEIDTSWFEKPVFLGTQNDKDAIDNYLTRTNVEGVVLKGKNDSRIKIKSQTYLELHRIRTDCTPKRIFEILESGKRLSDYDFPDEFIDDLKEIENKYIDLFCNLKDESILEAKKYETKTEKYIGLNKDIDSFIKSIIFNLRKNREIDSLIWKKLKSSINF